MSSIRLDDTIAAVSTPIGEGGIGIVRLSGKDSLKIADKIFLPKNGKKPSNFKTYTVHYGHVVDRNHPPSPKKRLHSRYASADARRSQARKLLGKGGQKLEIIDEVILTVMRAPRSYTKEDIVEINCHSGIVPLKKILDLVLTNGARLAEPGEFTKRAFLNGRIDILQAEAVLDIIRAKTDLSLKAALNNLNGLFSKKVQEIRDRLMDIYTNIEASIDFSEEDIDVLTKKNIFKGLNEVKKDIERLIFNSNQGKMLRQGIRTVICGSPNVGKSSLMNAILKESRSIVTHIPGTTRDTIEEVVNIKGIPVILVDTAGITDTEHPVEREGIRRSYLSLENADLVLLVLDYNRKLNRNDMDIINRIKGKKEVIIVINKIDLKKVLDVKKLRAILPKKSIVYVCSLNLFGIDKLEWLIKDIIWKGKVPSGDFITVSNERQIDALRSCFDDIKQAIDNKNNIPIDYTSVYVRLAIERLGEIVGESITEEALDRIFAEFCIGK